MSGSVASRPRRFAVQGVQGQAGIDWPRRSAAASSAAANRQPRDMHVNFTGLALHREREASRHLFLVFLSVAARPKLHITHITSLKGQVSYGLDYLLQATIQYSTVTPSAHDNLPTACAFRVSPTDHRPPLTSSPSLPLLHCLDLTTKAHGSRCFSLQRRHFYPRNSICPMRRSSGVSAVGSFMILRARVSHLTSPHLTTPRGSRIRVRRPSFCLDRFDLQT